MERMTIGEFLPLICQDYLFNSSSSDSEEEEKMIVEINMSIMKRKGNFLDDVRKFSNSEFQLNFRVERRTCIFLIEEFANSDSFTKHEMDGRSETISAEVHILYYLWFIGNRSTLRDVSKKFDVSVANAYLILERVIAYFLSNVGDIICFPKTNKEKEELANRFYDMGGFPNIVGCINGTLINIQTADKTNNETLTLHGICDANMKFMDVFTGAPDKINDSVAIKQIKNITNNGHYHLLGNDDYPIREWLLVPYTDNGKLTIKQQNFNKKLSETRTVMEKTFDILKSRFRQLSNLDSHEMKDISEFVISCCVLHNLCIDFNDELEVDEENIDEGNVVEEQQLKMLGDIKRNNICKMLEM